MLELLVLAIAPAAFLLWYIWKKDSYEPEPLRLVAWVFFLGALSAIPAFILEWPFRGNDVILGVFVAPVVEEFLKFLVVFLAVYHHPKFNEPMDGIVYATAAALGFAMIENIEYVFTSEQVFALGMETGIIRAITALPGHVIFSCIWGFALGMAKFRPASQRTVIIIAGLFGAMLLHGIYNAVNILVILLVIIPLGWWMTCRTIRCAHADPASACSAINNLQSQPGLAIPKEQLPLPHTSPAAPAPAGVEPAKSGRDSTQRFCAHCGAPNKRVNRFCENCGKEF